MKNNIQITLLLLFISCLTSFAQFNISGTVISKRTNSPISNAIVYHNGKVLATTNFDGYYQFNSKLKSLSLQFYALEFEMYKITINPTKDINLAVQLEDLSVDLNTIEIKAKKEKIFELNRLKDVEGTAIYAGKKTEVIQVNQSMANLATNNARQIFSQVAGLNIYQNDDAGLQLNIGGRGLDPNRTGHFNTRQNGYDISADVLGYPESYYTPPAEAIEQIQIIRGAASLQYGTQFGGLVNFVLKKPSKNKPFNLTTRNTIGSNNLYTNFTSIDGTKNKLSYVSYFNYKKGDGFRPNSEFESRNAYLHLGYQFNTKTKISAEISYLNYLAQQAGGLTDQMFNENPYQSNRTRNWFNIDWLLYNFKLEHAFSNHSNLSFSFFGLNAQRNALGFRTNRVSQVDVLEERDLIKGDFKNFGFETRFLHQYKLGKRDATFLIGTKFYKANNTSKQGPGSNGNNANFDFQTTSFPTYPNQADYTYPNTNLTLFGEHILYLNNKLSITPGFRLEYIKTESDGWYKNINTDAAGNVILDETINDQETKERSFLLAGLGLSYKPSSSLEFYANTSQNYRSVTFSDISIVNPAYTINPNIDDEKGGTIDVGVRGRYKKIISYDLSAFSLFYNDRIGFVPKAQNDGSVKTERGNVGDAVIYGFESLIDLNLNALWLKKPQYKFNYFINSSFINSKYTASQTAGIKNKKVEFTPEINIKTGVKFGYKNFLSNIQYSYLSSQFTDAQNSINSNLSGVIGEIPAYGILDFSTSYRYKKIKLEFGINNALDKAYFTRRATGYPGPGIIPSANRNYYLTLQYKI